MLIPAYDDVILYLSERRDELKCKLATSNKTLVILQDPREKLMKFYRENGTHLRHLK